MKNNSLFIAKLLVDVSAGIYFSHRLIALTNHGVSVSEAMFMSSIASFIGVALNLPAGILADKYGHKSFTVLGFILKCIGMFTLVIFHTYFSAFISFLLYIIGWCFEDGAYKTWLIHPFKNNNSMLSKINMKLAHISSWGFLSGAVIGSMLYDLNIQYPWVLAFSFTFAAATMAIISPNTNTTTKDNDKLERLRQIPATIRSFLKDKSIMSYLLVDLFLFASFGFLSASGYPYFNEIFPKNIIARVGLFQLSISLGRIVGNHIHSHLSHNCKNNNITRICFYLSPFLSAGILLIPIFNLSAVIFLFALFLRSIFLSFYLPKMWTVLDIIIRPHDKIRASAYSVIEIIRDLSSALAMFTASFLGGFPYKYIFIACLLFSILHILSVLKARKMLEEHLF